MLLASQDKRSMNARGSSDSERQNLLDRLLDAVKQCQVRFGGKTELATDTDSRVSCLLAQLLAIFGHGLKKPKGTIRAFMQVGQVAGITKQQELEPDFYIFIKEHLSKNEIERFTGLHHINSDTGRGRAWLRSTLNEHTLEKSIHNILGDKTLLRSYYEPEAFLLDEEKSSMLPMIAAGLSSILFALGIDKEELNAVKQVSPQLPSTKEVFSNFLPSFPASKPKEDPAAILAETTSSKETKKKKKKKKSAAIVSIDDVDSSREDLDENMPISDSSNYQSSYSKKTVKPGHSRSSSYPGKINVESSIDTAMNSFASQGFSREISLSDDSISKWTDKNSEELYDNAVYPGLSTSTSYTQSVETIEEKDEKHVESNYIDSDKQSIHDNTKSITVSLDSSQGNLTESLIHENTEQNNLPIESEKKNSLFSFKTFKSRKTKTNFDAKDNEEPFETSGANEEDMLSSSVTRESDSLMVMGGDDGLLPFTGNKIQEKTESSFGDNIEGLGDQNGEEDKNSSKDSVSLSSNSWFDDTDERPEQSEDDLMRARSESMSAATDAATAALELCSPSQLDPMASITSKGGQSNEGAQDVLKSQEDTMSTSELKQAIVSMMLRKDEIEDQNRVLRQLLEEKQREKEVMQAEVEQLSEESKHKEEQSVVQIAALTRENEVLKHQLKKYVGAVQMLRSNMTDAGSANTQALQGIRQDETLPVLPEQPHDADFDSANEAKEYKQKLIQVAEMHGELMEFNERLQLQYNYWQAQALRLQEELISLRGPLPDDCHSKETANVADPLTVAARNRPLINVWIPSVFLKGKGSAGVHHLYQVYIRIKDDEWNVYRRYSQFHELHKKLYKNHKIVDTFKFPSKKTFGNRGLKFVEERRKSLQEYIRHVVNLMISTAPELTSNTCKTTLLEIMPFFGDPFPPRKPSKKSSTKRKNTQPYDGL